MLSTVAADDIWQIVWWMPATFCILYIIPIFRLITFWFETKNSYFLKINKYAGLFEHVVWLPRDLILALYLLGGGIWHIIRAVETGSAKYVIISLIAIICIALGWSSLRWKRNSKLKFLKFVKSHPNIHPDEFFDWYLACYGLVSPRFPQIPFRIIDPTKVDFRDRKKTGYVGLWRIFLGFLDTIIITRLIILACSKCHISEAKEIASALSVVWGTRILEFSYASINIENHASLLNEDLPQIFLFTHASFVDFAMVPLALMACPNRKDFLPRFLIAKDHFKDNFFLYRILGLGLVAEKLGMIFVNRNNKNKEESAKNISSLAARGLISGSQPLAIFPQGSRAYGYVNIKEERIGAAYYTVGSKSRIAGEGKHLKKGAAYIATAVAHELSNNNRMEDVLVIPVAIVGSAILCPRDAMRIQANIQIKLIIGEQIIINPKDISEIKQGIIGYTDYVLHLHKRIDNRLKSVTRVHVELERRFFEEIRTLGGPNDFEEMAIAMKSWRGDDFLVHAILDGIYACPSKCWRPFVGELVHAIQNFSSREGLLSLKAKIASELSK